MLFRSQGVDPDVLQGNYIGFGNYKNLGFLNLDYMLSASKTVNYRRELDLEDGTARVTHELDGVAYTREYVASYPGGAIAVRIAASKPGQVSLVASVTPGQPDGKIDDTPQNPTICVTGSTITLSGGLQDNGMLYAGMFRVVNEGGMLAAGAQEIFVTGADAVTIYFTAATDYRNEYVLPEGSELFEQLTYRTGESLQELIARTEAVLEQAAAKDYANFLAEHQEDYRALFGRVALEIGRAHV